MNEPSEQRVSRLKLKNATGLPRPVLVGAICLLSSGLVHGLWTSRWSPETAQNGAAALNRIPLQIAGWESQELVPLNHPERLQSINRVYTNKRTGRSVTVIMIAGDPALVSDYPLTALMSGHGLRAVRDPVPVDVETRYDGVTGRVHHAFLNADYYEPASMKTEQMIALWAWTENGLWESPVKPLDRFVASPQVFRLFVTQNWDFAATSRPNDIEDFLTVAMPDFSRALGYQPQVEKPAKEKE